MANLAGASRRPFPDDQLDFQADDRISYNTSLDSFVLRDETGQEWQWISTVSKWTKAVDDEQIARQQSETYHASSSTHAEKDGGQNELGDERKRKAVDDQNRAAVGKIHKTKHQTSSDPPAKPERAPTAVYVTGLPLDTNVDEIHQVFARFGVVSESLENGEWRIKMYEDDEGVFKGEALVVYHRPESVPNAVMMLDGTDFRPEQPQTKKIGVAVADSSYKRQKDTEQQAVQNRRDPAAERKKKQLKKKYEEMNSRLGDWSDDEPQSLDTRPNASDKFLVLKAMFTLDLIREEPSEILEIKEDVRDECEKIGIVTNVVLYDLEPDGVVVVRFKSAEDAARAADVFDGRLFDGRRVVAYPSDGKEKFRKRGKEEDAAEEKARLERFGKTVAGEPTA